MLTDLACRKATAQDKEYRLADQWGMYLLVLPSGYRSWRMGYWHAKKKRRLVLGSYPEMSLQEARAARDVARALIAKGIDPGVQRKQDEAKRMVAEEATFSVIGDAWLAERSASWSKPYTAVMRRLLVNHLYPHWQTLPLTAITKPMVVQRLKAIEAKGIRETARRAREKIAEIFDYAEAMGHEVTNPGRVNAGLKAALPKRQPAITDLVALRDMLKQVEAAPAHPITKMASRFIALTAVRPGVAQLLPWAEIDAIDETDPLWIIPATRMKLTKERKELADFDHVVPLARQTIELLRCIRIMTGRSPFVFHSTNSTRKAISDSTVSKLYRDNGFRDQHVPHGWRSSFSTIMNERAMVAEMPGDRIVIDIMLAHQQDGVEPKYNRAAYLPRRKQLAQEWADMLLEGAMPLHQLMTGRRL